MISTHILDISLGHPAAGISVELAKHVDGEWTQIGSAATNADGRIVFSCPPEEGTYRLIFLVEDYLKKNKGTPFFHTIPVVFTVADTKRKYHVPLLLSPFGYSTYRGS